MSQEQLLENTLQQICLISGIVVSKPKQMGCQEEHLKMGGLVQKIIKWLAKYCFESVLLSVVFFPRSLFSCNVMHNKK